MARRRYTKRQRREAERVVRNHWKAIVIILALLVIMLAVLYFTGVLQKLVDKFMVPPPGEEQEQPEGSGDGGNTPSGPLNAGNYKGVTTTVNALKDLEVAFIDVGQGDCIIIELPDGKNMIIDSGDYRVSTAKSEITAYTTANNITKFDYLLLTHQDADHAGNMSWVIDNYEISYVFRPNNETTHSTYDAQLPDEFNYGNGYKSTSATYGKFMLSAYNEQCIVEVFNKNSDFTNTIKCGDDTYTYTFNFLTPTLDTISYSDANNYSAVMMLEYMDRRIMFTGDAELENLGEYVTTYSNTYNVDVLKVGHHGSHNATTAPFISAIDPEYAVIQCGDGNDYGHPHASALSILQSYDSNMKLYRTDNNGNILLTIDMTGAMNFTLEIADVSDNFTPGESTETNSLEMNLDIIFDRKKLLVA